MIGIAAVFGAVSIFAADFWLKSEASQQVETRTIEIQAPGPARRSNSRPSSWRRSRCASACSSTAPSSPKSRGRRMRCRKARSRPIDALLAEGSRVVLSPMEANEPVLLAKLSGPNGRASLSNLLTPGMRAVTDQDRRDRRRRRLHHAGRPGRHRADARCRRDRRSQEERRGRRRLDHRHARSSSRTPRCCRSGRAPTSARPTPQVASSVTIEVTADGAGKIALARNIGTLSLQLRALGRRQLGHGRPDDDLGFRRVGHEGRRERGERSSSKPSTKEPEGPKFKTVIVTRGLEQQSYQVVAPESDASASDGIAGVGPAWGREQWVRGRTIFGCGRLVRLLAQDRRGGYAGAAAGGRRRAGAGEDQRHPDIVEQDHVDQDRQGQAEDDQDQCAVLRDRHRRSRDRQRQSAHRQLLLRARQQSRHHRHRAVRREQAAGRQRRHRGDARHRQAGEHHPRHRSRRRHRREVGQRPPGAVRLGRRCRRCRQGDSDRDRVFRRGEGHQLGQHLVLAAGPAQRPLRRGQPPGRPGARHADRGRLCRAERRHRLQLDPQSSSSTPAGSLVGSLLSGGFSIDVAHQGAGGSRRRPPSGRAQPDRALRREGELPGRRRIPDPGLGRRRPDHRHLQEIRRQPRFHADRAAGRTDQPRYRAGGFGDRPVVVLQGRRHLDPRLHRPARPDVGRSEERPELHDRRPAAEPERHRHAAHSRPGQGAGARRAVQLQGLPAPRDRSGDHRHALSGQADGSDQEAADAARHRRNRPAPSTISSATSRRPSAGTTGALAFAGTTSAPAPTSGHFLDLPKE